MKSSSRMTKSAQEFARSHELTESDPKIFHELRSSTLVPPTVKCDDVARFINAIASDPDIPALARLRKGSFKKVLSVLWLV